MGFGIDVILRKEMEAREKLREALYFLEEIKKLEDQGRSHTFSEDEFRKRNLALGANLSAFILAWASIPDILLYDFAERFSLAPLHADSITPPKPPVKRTTPRLTDSAPTLYANSRASPVQ